MSRTIRIYRSIIPEDTRGPGPSSSMYVTAYVGGKYGSCIQLTTENDHVCLAENQVRDLITILQARLELAEGFNATGGGVTGAEKTRTIEPEESA